MIYFLLVSPDCFVSTNEVTPETTNQINSIVGS